MNKERAKLRREWKQFVKERSYAKDMTFQQYMQLRKAEEEKRNES